MAKKLLKKKSYKKLRDNDKDIGNIPDNISDISDYESSHKFEDSNKGEAAEELPDADLGGSIYQLEEMLEFPDKMREQRQREQRQKNTIGCSCSGSCKMYYKNCKSN